MEEASKGGSRSWPLAAGLGAAAFALYLATLAPGLLWGDSARFVERSIGYAPGAEPGEHHLRNWLGLLANQLPWGSIPWRQNLVSAVFGALAVAQVVRVALLATGSRWGATFAAVALALSHTQWHLSAFCESYSLLAFLILVAVELLLRWRESGAARWAVGAAFVCGLAASDHLFTFVLGPVFALFLVVGRPWPRGAVLSLSWVPLLALAFLVGYAPSLAGGIRAHMETGRAWREVFYDLLDLRGQKYFADDPGDVLRFWGLGMLYLGYQFPFVSGLLGLLGLGASLRDGARRATLPLLVFLATFAWAGLYLQQRNVYLLLVGYAMFAIWIGRGAEALRAWFLRSVEGPVDAAMAGVLVLVALAPPLLYAVTPRVVDYLGVHPAGVEGLRAIHGRRATWILCPWKNGEDSAERFGREALKAASPGAAIVYDFTPGAVLSYVQRHEGFRPDVELVPLDRAAPHGDLAPWLERTLDRNDVFLADDAPVYGVDRLHERYDVTRVGPLWRVRRR